MAIIDKIQLSGTVYTIGNETTTAVTSASTDNEIPTAKAVYDAIPQGGGGKAVSAGRGISITTGETADTVSFNLPISAGTRTNALIYNSTTNSASGNYSNAEGEYTTASGYYSHAEGYIAKANGYASHAEGESTKSNGYSSHAEGTETEANGDYSHSEGHYTRTTNESEHSSGRYNNSVSASTTWGNSGNTLFSVGNGKSNSSRHNAIDIRQNGDIYIADTNDTSTTNYYEKPMIKLQDALGGGGGSITIDQSLDSGSTNAVANSAITTAINEKQNKLTASGGISINQYQNTIFLDLPIYKAKDFRSCFVGDDPNWPNIVSGRYSFAVGLNNNVTGNYSLAVGGLDSYGEGNSATTINTFAFGRGNIAKSFCSTVVGYHNSSSNEYETDFGIYNNSVSASTTFGDSGNTLFSVGNGTADNARHNAFEIRQNGDIYISKDGQDVKLQDQLGGGGSSYTAGDGIDISNDVISVTGKVDTSTYNTYTAATDTALREKANTATTYTKTEVIKQITAITNPINSTLTAHTADTVIHVTSDEKAAWNGKQDALVSGTNIKTINNQSILGEGNITIQGGSDINVVQTTGTSTADVMSQDAVTTQLNGKGDAIGIDMVGSPKKKVTFQMRRGGVNGTVISSRDLTLGRGLVYGEEGFDTLSTSGLVETSAITTSISSSSTDTQVPSAKAVYDMVGNIETLLSKI